MHIDIHVSLPITLFWDHSVVGLPFECRALDITVNYHLGVIWCQLENQILIMIADLHQIYQTTVKQNVCNLNK